MCTASPERVYETVVAAEPVAVAGEPIRVMPYKLEVPYSKYTAVSLALALMMPFRTADVLVMVVAGFVTADGIPTGEYVKPAGPTQLDSLPSLSFARTQIYSVVPAVMVGAVHELVVDV